MSASRRRSGGSGGVPELLVWFLGGWLVASLVLAAVLSRWLRRMR
jgi:hypothetical protein